MNQRVIAIFVVLFFILLFAVPYLLVPIIPIAIGLLSKKNADGTTALHNIISKVTDKTERPGEDIDRSSRRPSPQKAQVPDYRRPTEPERGPEYAARSDRRPPSRQRADRVRVNGHTHMLGEDCEHEGYATAYSTYAAKRGGRNVEPWELPPEKAPWE